MDSLDVKLLKRLIGQRRAQQSIRPLYADHTWTKDLDIVNELGGHTGCVNALSWSTSGRFLASGSDDTYLNVWEHNPADQTKPFTLNTSVSTGHQANIFSVKFMPHSGDRTVVTCAGDSQVRVFDLEYAAGAQAATGVAESTRSRRFNNFFGNCKWLTEANTNARVYRSHADRAKRIVTESSPHLFLSCSEDGEVRQWDLRQPSSAYPPPRNSRVGFRRFAHTEGSDNVPPPLISYKSYGLDLNTISCSKSQPHYIALGGAHLHCFLHDRRMLGRDIDAEKGRPNVSTPEAGTPDDESMREATRCVRRFAPNNKRKMKPGDHGHITACKISDARPNELISSWSGDHVYSFDIVKGPDTRDIDHKQDRQFQRNVLTNRAERKRKRANKTASSASNDDGAKNGRRLRRVSDKQTERGQVAVQAQDENSHPAAADEEESISTLLTAHEVLLSEAQKQSERVAKALVELRKTLFDFSILLAGDDEEDDDEPLAGRALTRNTSRYTKALGQASSLLPEMEEVMRSWTYPNTTDEDEVLLQNTLRRNRQSAWRFVQAAGCISATLGGKIQTPRVADDPRLAAFLAIKPAALEGDRIDNDSRFYYDFAKAINLWLVGGVRAVLEGFKRPPEVKHNTLRYPFDETVDLKNVATKLREYLLPIAPARGPILDLGMNRFERDDLHELFESPAAAVRAFTNALEQIGALTMNQGASGSSAESGDSVQGRVMDKGAAARFWGERVCRSLLMSAAEGVTFNFVNRAFGGLTVHIMSDDETIDTLLEEAADAEMGIDNAEQGLNATTASSQSAAMRNPPEVIFEEVEEEEEDQDDNDEDASDDNRTESGSEDEETELLHDIYRSRRHQPGTGPLSIQRATVNSDVHYTSHTKVYKGHCNTRTVKDVNYYGMDDEYIVSGSDDGNFFIWDRKTTEIVTVLEGDGEVVNVVQGHPYEPMIAASGIDSTIKIFGVGGDNRERYHARRGIDIANPGRARHNSLGLRRSRRHADVDDNEDDDEDQPVQREDIDEPREKFDDLEVVARGGLRSRKVPLDKVYEITSQNDSERRRGMGEAFMTQDMLARLVIAAQNGQLQGIQGFGGAGGMIAVDENCSIM